MKRYPSVTVIPTVLFTERRRWILRKEDRLEVIRRAYQGIYELVAPTVRIDTDQ